MSDVNVEPAWPELPPPAAWQDTLDTLHLYTQIPGKIRLALSPHEPEWAHVTLYVTARGLTTGPIPSAGRYFQMDFDFIAHQFRIDVSDGKRRVIELVPRSVKDFYAEVMDALRALGIEVRISAVPAEVPNPISFETDTTHRSYVAADVERFFQALERVDEVMSAHRAPFRGRHTRVQFFWGGFDLSYSRYSGRPAPQPPGADLLRREGMDAEEVCAGFWFGDARYPNPAFYCYEYPKPDALPRAAIQPVDASWNETLGLFVLPYESVRSAAQPRKELLTFLGSTFDAAASLAKWPAFG